MLLELHFAEHAFALELFLEGAERLLNVVIADDDLYYGTSPSGSVRALGPENTAEWA